MWKLRTFTFQCVKITHTFLGKNFVKVKKSLNSCSRFDEIFFRRVRRVNFSFFHILGLRFPMHWVQSTHIWIVVVRTLKRLLHLCSNSEELLFQVEVMIIAIWLLKEESALKTYAILAFWFQFWAANVWKICSLTLCYVCVTK